MVWAPLWQGHGGQDSPDGVLGLIRAMRRSGAFCPSRGTRYGLARLSEEVVRPSPPSLPTPLACVTQLVGRQQIRGE